MNLKLKRIAPLQAGKMLAVFYGLLSLVFVPFMMLFMFVASLAARQAEHPAPLPFMFGMGMGFVIFLPLVYAGMGFIFGALGAWIYNLVAKWIGGFELDFEQTTPPPAS